MAYALFLQKRLKLLPEYSCPLSDLICSGTPNKLTASSMNHIAAADAIGAGISRIRGYLEK